MGTLKLKCLLVGVSLALSANVAVAGPVIIDGTDSADHGSVLAGVNQNGWEYMQRALQNLAGAVNPAAAKVVVDIGTATGSQARSAIDSAFSLSTLPGAGWTIVHIDTAASVTAWLASLSTTNTGILYLPTFGLVGGDMDSAEMAAVNAGSTNINNFVAGAGNPAAGGALFSQGETGTGAYGWLTTLVPGIVATDAGGGGIATDITLTAAGSAAFPGLSNTDLAGADPWHGYFSGNLGGLSVLGTALEGIQTRNVIIGGGAGTVIGCGQPGQPPCPPQLPEPESLPLLAIGGLAFALATVRRRKARK